ncbi:hypothetical protein CMI37_17750 [Candidatus Pacearchaeota archaeon]|nr:hypothetical protein [Candidatus Pacearchaeota archaeon]
MVTSAWVTNKKYGFASREAGGLTLVHHRGVFILLTDKVLPVGATSFSAAIDKADSAFPPDGWSFVVGMWLAPGWKVKKEEDGWFVYGEGGEQKSKQAFPRADRARKWCEVRNDRVGLSLRGPKPKKREEG